MFVGSPRNFTRARVCISPTPQIAIAKIRDYSQSSSLTFPSIYEFTETITETENELHCEKRNLGALQPSTQAFSSRSHDLARNFVTSPNDISHQVESNELEENAWVLGCVHFNSLTFQCPVLFKVKLNRVHRDDQKSKDGNTGNPHNKWQQGPVK